MFPSLRALGIVLGLLLVAARGLADDAEDRAERYLKARWAYVLREADDDPVRRPFTHVDAVELPFQFKVTEEAMQHESEVRTVVLSPDGEVVLTCGYDKMARLWSAHDGRPLSPPLPHKGEVRAGAFRPDGKVVATASADGTVRLWEVPGGRSLMPPLFHDGWVRSVAFSPDGKTLATACDDGTARLWTPPPPVGGTPDHVALWVQVLTGMELHEDGTVQVLPADMWQQRRRQLDEHGGPPPVSP